MDVIIMRLFHRITAIEQKATVTSMSLLCHVVAPNEPILYHSVAVCMVICVTTAPVYHGDVLSIFASTECRPRRY